MLQLYEIIVINCGDTTAGQLKGKMQLMKNVYEANNLDKSCILM